MSLSIVHEALKTDAQAEAASLEEAARRDAEALLEHTRAEAHAALDAAREEGRAIAERDAAHELARRRREVRATVLGAHRALYDETRRRAQEEALALRGSPHYAKLLEKLSERVREQLGADADIDVDPDDRGGVVGRSGDQRVDYTLPSLVERCLALYTAEIVGLWT